LEFSPAYPVQWTDISYGRGGEYAFTTPLVSSDARNKYQIVIDPSIGNLWQASNFEDGRWRTGRGGLGFFSEGQDFSELVTTEIRGIYPRRTTFYARYAFTVEQPAELPVGRLSIQYDDGFVAYLNGVEVVRRNAPVEVNSTSQAINPQKTARSFIGEDFVLDLNTAIPLKEGNNVLAVQGLNIDAKDGDMLVRPVLEAGNHNPKSASMGYFQEATPWRVNGRTYPQVLHPPRFSHGSGTFVEPFLLTLTPGNSGAVIHYTLDGSLPTEDSAVYAEAIPIQRTTIVRVREFRPGFIPSPIMSESYLAMDSELGEFSSNLPLIVLENFLGGIIPENEMQPAFMAIFEPRNGRSQMIWPPDLATRIGLKRRGQSSASRVKASYGFEAWDEWDEDKDISPLGLPEDSDWILYGPYDVDRALMRNPFIFELSNQIGRYAVRTRFVEVFLHDSSDPLTYSNYRGLYVLMEKIKRGINRVDVEPLSTDYNYEPQITGGYMLKMDIPDPGDSGFKAGGQDLLYHDPKESEVTAAQAAWIKDYIDTFDQVLDGPNSTDPDRGYAQFIEVGSWIDHHLVVQLGKNPDGLWKSTYMFKRRGGKLEMGPLWDFDRTMGPHIENRAKDPAGWINHAGRSVINWWNILFKDPEFWQRYRDGWRAMRQGPLQVDNLDSIIDVMAAELTEAQERNFERWTAAPPGPGGWEGEVQHLRLWLRDRVDWIDSQLISILPPRFSQPGGVMQPGFALSMATPSGSVYYTLDGSDPRLAGGNLNPRAILLGEGQSVALVGEGAQWRYLDDGSNQESAWRDPLFDDTSWEIGPARLGYGEAALATKLAQVTEENVHPITYYFRHTFSVDDPAAFPALVLKWLRDDGGIVYLNGQELARSNIHDGEIQFDTLAHREVPPSSEKRFFRFELDGSFLQAGKNVLAVELHTSGRSNLDIGFDLELAGLPRTGAPIGLVESTTVTARALEGDEWSVPTEATFLMSGISFPLRITELMYHPPEGSSLEFIELANLGPSPLNLDGMGFEGICYIFPAGARIGPGEVIVLASSEDPVAFSERYPGLEVFGHFTCAMSNGGETILLTDAGGEVVTSVTYRDQAPWPTSADGAGVSLEVINPLGNQNDSQNWRASAAFGGSPGSLAGVPPEIESVVLEDGQIRIRFQAQPGYPYIFYTFQQLPPNELNVLTHVTAEGTERLVEVTDQVKPGNMQKFYLIATP
jgi:hypothetical protein